MNSSGAISATGEFIEIDSPWDLDPLRFQHLRSCGALICACLPERELPLTIVQHRTRPHVRRLRDLDNHAPDCPFNRDLESRISAPDLWRDSIVFGDAPADALAFRLLARCLFSRAYTSAIMEPSSASLMVRTCAALRTEIASGYYFASGKSLAEVARPTASVICGYIVDISPVAAGDGKFPIVIWSAERGGLAPHPLCHFCEAGVLTNACRAMTIFGQRIRGPYLAIGIQRDSLIEKIILFPVVISGGHVAPVDSDSERQLLLHYWKFGHQVYKPLRREELNALPARWRSKHGTNIRYQFRPDLLIQAANGPMVVELKGFDSDQTPSGASYLASFAAKASNWRQLVTDGHCRYVEHTIREFEPRSLVIEK